MIRIVQSYRCLRPGHTWSRSFCNRLDENLRLRRIEKSIGKQVKSGATEITLKTPEDELREKEAKDLVVRSRGTTTGQTLYPAEPEDIEILSKATHRYIDPFDTEGSVIIRLVRLSDPVVSPVGRVVRNKQYGIRGNEKWHFLMWGLSFVSIVYMLGFWQLYRMKWKADLIERRRSRLAMPRIFLTHSPFPWADALDDYEYRVVEARGVFDHEREMFVGPRPGTDSLGERSVGFLVITPLVLEDGSRILVNRGHIPYQLKNRVERIEYPEWVRVRGVLEPGEIVNTAQSWVRLKNRPDKDQFLYLVPSDLAENSNARNHSEAALAVITAYDMLYEDEYQQSIIRRRARKHPFVMKKKDEYLLFWADEHVHFNYAMQWFAMGTLVAGITAYKFIEILRWRW